MLPDVVRCLAHLSQEIQVRQAVHAEDHHGETFLLILALIEADPIGSTFNWRSYARLFHRQKVTVLVEKFVRGIIAPHANEFQAGR